MFFKETMFRGKTVLVIQKDFDYDPVGPGQTHVLREVCKQLRKLGGNEYDAAIAFMFVQIDALTINKETKKFRLEKAMIADRLANIAKLPITKETARGLTQDIMREA